MSLEENNSDKSNSDIDYKSEYESIKSVKDELESQVTAMKNKNAEILDELKKERQKIQEIENKKQEEKTKKAKEEGDYPQLLESSEKERKALSEKLQALENQISKEKINNTAMKIASELADGSNAEILSRFISDRLIVSDGQVKVLDEKGNKTVLELSQLKDEFAANVKYNSLLRGSLATGGGATGGKEISKHTAKIDRSKPAVQRLSEIWNKKAN